MRDRPSNVTRVAPSGLIATLEKDWLALRARSPAGSEVSPFYNRVVSTLLDGQTYLRDLQRQHSIEVASAPVDSTRNRQLRSQIDLEVAALIKLGRMREEVRAYLQARRDG